MITNIGVKGILYSGLSYTKKYNVNYIRDFKDTGYLIARNDILRIHGFLLSQGF